ncbi:MAG: hypothetical protein JSS04_28585 [Proteobacteria bacterium]|nr:hypothetical protein [Pseudomonadota bacterium]
MGAFTGACILAMGVGYLEPRLGAQAAPVGGLAGFVGGLWLTLRRGGHWGGSAIVALTGIAIMLAVSLGYVAFSG